MTNIWLIVTAGVVFAAAYNMVAPQSSSKLINTVTTFLVVGMMICMYQLGRAMP
ncbi:hypothetical protein [Pseudomonas fluorescens]|uniref:hypothetical protein n=1 Tax=Pseudomonas fluorescens TaxID=294 RepID=UPI0016556DCE|nr:hypothetical protein [Pseudomonas fluorescens]MBC8786538.1 hypothetical protein [Pseudomonas fluorescens]